MAVSPEFLSYVLEQLRGLGQVTSRRMFSGVGFYSDGFFFGLIYDETLFFKVDDRNRADYESRGMARFRPYADKPVESMSYYAVPVEVLEEDELLVSWARKSVAAAMAAPKRRPLRSKKTISESARSRSRRQPRRKFRR